MFARDEHIPASESASILFKSWEKDKTQFALADALQRVELIVRVLACLAEGLGIRAPARVCEVDPNTALREESNNFGC